eukprot:7210769-Pyramimonas_sp.AAC.1
MRIRAHAVWIPGRDPGSLRHARKSASYLWACSTPISTQVSAQVDGRSTQHRRMSGASASRKAPITTTSPSSQPPPTLS